MAIKLDQKVKEREVEKLDVRLTAFMLNSVIGFILKDSVVVSKKALNNIYKLFGVIDESRYNDSPQLLARIKFIKVLVKKRLEDDFTNVNSLIQEAIPDVEDNYVNEILKSLPEYSKLNYNELKSISKAIEDRLKYLFIIKLKDKMYDALQKIETNTFKSFNEVNTELLNVCTNYINASRKVTTLDKDNSLSLSDFDFDDKIKAIVESLTDPARLVKTGLMTLNEMLGGGYAAKRLYIYMGLPSGFKSGVLLKSIVDTKRYNLQLKTKDPNKLPTALLVTMENYLEETVERLFNMVGPSNDIRTFSPKQVIDIIKEDGGMTVTDKNKIDIVIRYFPNRTISTQDLYVLIDDLEDDNREVSILVLDYIKRIKPAEYGKDEKEELKNITNELKSLAIDKNIAVVSAHQLNREAARSVDAAMQTNKTDIARFVGRANVGSAWEVMENSDCVIIINKEMKRSTKQQYLTFKKIKQRYRVENPIDYFNHPFDAENTMKLVDDIMMDKTISEISLSEEFVDSSDETVNVSNGKRKNATTRMELIPESQDFRPMNEL